MFEVLDAQYDKVIKCKYYTAKADYDFAITQLVPLISRLDYQRNPLQATFYKRLEKDIIDGCIMPPITIAIRDNTDEWPIDIESSHVVSKFKSAFILDGIQRLTTLNRICKDQMFESSRPIYINILVCDSMDRLLYRMVTLNNGQRPMSARHQIEILAANIFDFQKLPILIISEKQLRSKGFRQKKETDAMSKEVIIKGYLAFISNSINIDNQKIMALRQ